LRSSFTQEEIDAFTAIEAEIPCIRETLEGLIMVDVKYFIHLIREASSPFLSVFLVLTSLRSRTDAIRLGRKRAVVSEE
jgi:hypothetical protein